MLLPGGPARGQRFQLLSDHDKHEFVVVPRMKGGASNDDPEAVAAAEHINDAAVLKRFGQNVGESMPKGTLQAHQTYLRAFGIWLRRNFPKTDGLTHIERADQAAVDFLVNRYRDAIGRSSTHGAHIGGAIAALRGTPPTQPRRSLRPGDRAVLERFGNAARAAGLTVGAIKTYQADLRALSHWLDEHHPEQRGLTGVVCGDGRAIQLLLQAFQQTNRALDISAAVEALRRLGQP